MSPAKLTIKQAAERAGVKRAHIQNLMRYNLFKIYDLSKPEAKRRHYLIDTVSFDKFVESREIKFETIDPA